MEGFDAYRVGYVVGRWNVSKNCAKALQLFELGKTASFVARALDVTEGTANGYRRELNDKIHTRATEAVTSSKPRFDVFGERGASGYETGKSHGEAARESVRPATPKELLDATFRPRVTPLNKGVPLSAIDAEHITIRG